MFNLCIYACEAPVRKMYVKKKTAVENSSALAGALHRADC